ncbi:MAG: polysulfide reductase NrfD [Comamonadaceae bacterium]|nr:polysulfide reductase NrfD [Comamonadaceae bacterium]
MKITLRELKGSSPGYYTLLGGLALVALIGLASVWYMEHNGHIVTGMNNEIVWGLPHVFAVFLVVAASGALNVASMASVFGKTEFKPLAPLSGMLAISLLIGGLAVLMLDLGRPDRLIVAMTYYNFKSIFALNIFLYSGFTGFVIVYLWTMMEHRMNRFTPLAGLFAFIWRMALTTGTGSIFGFLVARQAYDSALLAPLFIALSFSYGLAVFLLVLMAASVGSGRPIGDAMMARFARLQVIFISAGLYFVTIYYLTNLYFTRHHAFDHFILLSGSVYTYLFWLGPVTLGGVLPLALLLHPRIGQMRRRIVACASLVVAGGFAQMYVTIIGGQAFPLVLFPGKEVSSSFSDGVINSYSPTLPEWLLGFGGIAIVGIIVLLSLKVLGFLPADLAEEDIPTTNSTSPATAH